MWKGFYKESKSFMCYDNKNIFGKIKFYIKYPYAYCRFMYFMYKDKLRSN